MSPTSFQTAPPRVIQLDPREDRVDGGGFEPPKSLTTDLQSAPFGHSGTLPYFDGAGGRTRTPDLLITNQLLYQLSYTSILPTLFSCLDIIS